MNAIRLAHVLLMASLCLATHPLQADWFGFGGYYGQRTYYTYYAPQPVAAPVYAYAPAIVTAPVTYVAPTTVYYRTVTTYLPATSYVCQPAVAYGPTIGTGCGGATCIPSAATVPTIVAPPQTMVAPAIPSPPSPTYSPFPAGQPIAPGATSADQPPTLSNYAPYPSPSTYLGEPPSSPRSSTLAPQGIGGQQTSGVTAPAPKPQMDLTFPNLDQPLVPVDSTPAAGGAAPATGAVNTTPTPDDGEHTAVQRAPTSLIAPATWRAVRRPLRRATAPTRSSE